MLVKQNVLVLSIILITLIGCEEKQTKKIVVPNDLLENGDIVLKCGYGPVSKLIINTLDEAIPISHCGIICKQGDSCYVIHSVASQVSNADGVQALDFREFLKDTKPESLFILRHKSEPNKRSELVKRAKHLLAKRVPFDHHYDHTDSSTLYCSEFVYKVCLDVYGENYFSLKQFPTGEEILLFNPILFDEHFSSVYGKLD